MGNDPSHPTSPGNICLIVPIYEGGFINVESLPTARYVFLYRRKDFIGAFNLSSARAFQAPNLLEQPDVAIIADYTSPNSYQKENLITNMDVRVASKLDNPVVDSAGNATNDFDSCYVT